MLLMFHNVLVMFVFSGTFCFVSAGVSYSQPVVFSIKLFVLFCIVFYLILISSNVPLFSELSEGINSLKNQMANAL